MGAATSSTRVFEPAAVRRAYRRFWSRCAIAGTIGWVLLWWPGFLVRDVGLESPAADLWAERLPVAAAIAVAVLFGFALHAMLAALRECSGGPMPWSIGLRVLWWLGVVGIPASVLALVATTLLYFPWHPILGGGLGPTGATAVVLEVLVFLIAAATASMTAWFVFRFSLAELESVPESPGVGRPPLAGD